MGENNDIHTWSNSRGKPRLFLCKFMPSVCKGRQKGQQMKLSDKTYNFLKWFALVAIPALEAFWLTVGKVWNFPYLTEIGTTIAAVGLFIAALIGVSSKNFYEIEPINIEGMEYIEDEEDEQN